MWGHKSLGPWEQDLYYDESVGHHALGGVSCETVSLPLLSHLMWPFYLLSGGGVQVAFGSFSEDIVPCVAVGVLCSWEEVSSGSL